MELSNKISDYLSNLFANKNLEASCQFDQKGAFAKENEKNHIFYALSKYVVPKADNFVAFTYLYSVHNKLLRDCWGKNFNMAEYHKNELLQDSLYENVNTVGKEAMFAITNPAIAFYYYKLLHHYDEAIIKLNESVQNIDFMIADGFKDGMFMKIEQKLNMFRVYASDKNYSQATKHAVELLDYIVGSEAFNFEFPFQEVVQNPTMYHNIINLYVGSFIGRARVNSSDDLYDDGFLKDIFCNLSLKFNELIDPEVKVALQSVPYLLSGETEEAFAILSSTDVFNSPVPLQLQALILSSLLKQDGVYDLMDKLTAQNIKQYGLNILSTNFTKIDQELKELDQVA